MSLNIRVANINDIPTIFALIKELAEYEKLLHEVTTNENILRNTLFRKNPNAEVLILEEHGVAIGFCAYFYNFSTFLGKNGIYIEDIYIKEQFRGNGYGSSVFEYLTKLALEKDCDRIDWWVLNWNKKAIDFYEKLGAVAMKEWTVFRLNKKQINNICVEKQQ